MEVNNHIYQIINFTDTDLKLRELVLTWRNHESVRKWMYNSDEIDLESHLSFIKTLKTRSDKLYFLVKRDENYIGVFSIIDYNGMGGEWGYYLAPEYHKKHLGVEFYYAVFKYCFEILNMKYLDGYVLVNNKNAISLNTLFGFEFLGIETSKIHLGDFFKLKIKKEKWLKNISSNKKILQLLNLTK